MYPPHLCGFSAPSSTAVLLGCSLLVIHPSSVLPSNSSIHPSDFSSAVNSLSPAETAADSNKTAQKQALRRSMVILQRDRRQPAMVPRFCEASRMSCRAAVWSLPLIQAALDASERRVQTPGDFRGGKSRL